MTQTYDRWADEHGDMGQDAYLNSFPFDADDDPDLPQTCDAMTHFEGYGPTAINPPEYCDRDVVPGSDYCPNHQGYEER